MDDPWSPNVREADASVSGLGPVILPPVQEIPSESRLDKTIDFWLPSSPFAIAMLYALIDTLPLPVIICGFVITRFVRKLR